MPSWPLLLWSGLAATVITVWILGVLMPAAGAHALAPQARRMPGLQAFALGVFVYPLAYAIPFQLLHNANLVTGAVLGIAHALLLALTGTPERPDLHAAGQRAASVILYGALLGFTYVTP